MVARVPGAVFREILLLSAPAAAQRIFAAFHPDDPSVYAWPRRSLAWCDRARSSWSSDPGGERIPCGADSTGSPGEDFGAPGGYVRRDWAPPLIAPSIAIFVFVILNPLGGPVPVDREAVHR